MVYWFDEETGRKTTSLSYPVHDLVASDFTQSRTAVIDVSNDYDAQPNRATLNVVAQDYAERMTSKPSVGIEVKFVDLNSTTEGGAEAPVKLCDTIHVVDPIRDVDLTAKVIETKWNVLLDRYDDVTVGVKGKNIADTIAGLQSGGAGSSGAGGGEGEVILTKTFTFTVSFSAGTIGTRGYQGNQDILEGMDGFTPVATSIGYVGASASYLPVAFFDDNKTKVYLNAYRATASAVSGSTVWVDVIYKAQ